MSLLSIFSLDIVAIVTIAIVGLLFIFTIIYQRTDNTALYEKAVAKQLEKERQKAEEREIKGSIDKKLDDLSLRLGDCVFKEYADNFLGNWRDLYDFDKHIFVFEKSQVVIIKSKEYKFSDILSCSLVDDVTNETITTTTGKSKTATGSMLGRAVVGGVLTGGLGAVAGAATAKRNITEDASSKTTTVHDYFIYINTNNFQEPVISLHIGNDSGRAQRIIGVMNVIMAKNKD
jgi:hypothetical protein